MAGQGEVLVDLTYRGLEVGRRLRMREVGPSTAYIEHVTPMPVGSELVLAVDDGQAVPVVVLRVHEQVAGADMPPGMRVRATALEGAAAGWWRGLVSRDDPQIPEIDGTPVSPPAPEPRAPAAPPQPPIVAPREEGVLPAGDGEDDRPTTVMNAVSPPPDDEAPGGGNGSHRPESASRTVQMSAVEIEEALARNPGEDTDPEGSGGGNGESGTDDRGPRGKRRGRRGRRR